MYCQRNFPPDNTPIEKEHPVRGTITVSLPEAMKADLDEATKKEGISRSEMIREALKEYLIVRRFKQLRQEMIPYAQNQGIHTDQDVFDRIS